MPIPNPTENEKR